MQANLYSKHACRDSKRFGLLRQIAHERAHLVSFLGSDLAKVHRSILDLQLKLAQCILWEVHRSRLIEKVTVPIVDSRGRMFPNALSPHPKLKVGVAAARYRELDALNQFLVGYAPDCEWKALLRAYGDLISVANGSHASEPTPACHQFCEIGSPDRPLETFCFMSEHHYSLIAPQICNALEEPSCSVPILPKIQVHDVPGSESPMLLSSRSVLEGVAVISELMSMREHDSAWTFSARMRMPVTYRSALVYCLHCINHVSGRRYSQEHLFSGALPDWVPLTMGAMLDLALQIEAPESLFGNHTALIEKCPAWRLLLVGANLKAREIPLLNPGATFDGPEIRAWLRNAANKMGCHSQQKPRTAHLPWPRMEITGPEVFAHLTLAAATVRDRHSLLYLTGRAELAPGDWLDFTACETRDCQQIFFGEDHVQARRDFLGAQEARHYSVPALVFGRHWDRCWQRRRVQTPQNHSAYIGRQLSDALEWGAAPFATSPATKPAFRDEQILVREEFNHVLGGGRARE
ncbi:hypothetical protein [Steroidobacter cummioxidans]|uniref:hypothetical protein n=1 Tax=Steroidobacter cummioxidans TaxID=1803913 RepID=UPI001290707E|nr:hypothetical protein [Steroidobacter cummioxidans]